MRLSITKKRARLSFDLTLLAELLHLPPGVTIERITTDPRIYGPRHCELVLAGDELPVPATPTGELLPIINGTYVRDDDVLTGIPHLQVVFKAGDVQEAG